MKSKKAFMLGAAMAASCFVSAFALAEQYPHLAAQAVKPDIKQSLKAAGKVPATKASAALKKRVDPTDKFRNKLWDAYYLQPTGR